MFVVPLGSIGGATAIAAGEDGVDFIEPLVLNQRKRQRRLRFDDDAASLEKINRLGRPKDPVLVDGMDGFHASGDSICGR